MGLRDLILASHNETIWHNIFQASGLNEADFVSMQSYPDTLSYQLVGAACQVLNISSEVLLEDFGRFWVLKTGPSAYGSLLDMSGDSIPELLSNLDELHVHLNNMMPNLKPPSFSCEHITDHGLTLHYRSSRQGLTAMVLGLIDGIGQRFKTPCTAKVIRSQENVEGVHVTFQVQWQ